MRIQREGGQVWLRDRAGLFWGLGVFLLAGGVVGVAMPLGLAVNAGVLEPWERLVIMGVGLGVCAAALWWLAQNPRTTVHFDLARRSMRLVRWGILGREVRELRLDQLTGAMVEESEDSDGGKVWRPAVHLRDGGVLLLSELWSHDERGVRTTVTAVAEVCRLPPS